MIKEADDDGETDSEDEGEEQHFLNVSESDYHTEAYVPYEDGAWMLRRLLGKPVDHGLLGV